MPVLQLAEEIVDVHLGEEILDRWRSLVNDPERKRSLASAEQMLGLSTARPGARHYLAQFRIYRDDLTMDSLYYSALSSGYMMTSMFPFPLRQIGVKLPVSVAGVGRMREAYFDALKATDVRGAFPEATPEMFNDHLIGFGVDLSDGTRLVQRYEWASFATPAERRIELRTDLRSGVCTSYFRCRLDTKEPVLSNPGLSQEDFHNVCIIANALHEQYDRTMLDPVMIYSRKTDCEGRKHLAIYLTSRPFMPSEDLVLATSSG